MSVTVCDALRKLLLLDFPQTSKTPLVFVCHGLWCLIEMSVTVCDFPHKCLSRSVGGGGRGSGSKFLPLKLQHFLSVRVSQKRLNSWCPSLVREMQVITPRPFLIETMLNGAVFSLMIHTYSNFIFTKIWVDRCSVKWCYSLQEKISKKWM